MKEFTVSDLGQELLEGVRYAHRIFLQSPMRWAPAALVAVVTDLSHAYQKLFWVVVGLWACDLAVGFARAWHEPGRELEWGKTFKSVLKLVVIAAGIGAVHLLDHLLIEGGLDTGERLTTATLLVIGLAEGSSVLGNMVYFWPDLGAIAEQVRRVVGDERRRGGGDRRDGGAK